jgi:hypothetical protein
MTTTETLVNGVGEWVHLVPFGEFRHGGSGKLQVLDERAHQSIDQRFQQEAARPNFAGLLVDQEHWSYDLDKSSESFGWVKELERRGDGIWGRIEFTDSGANAVANRRYKFVSPVFDPLESLGEDRLRPLRLDSVGLTNNPGLKGMVPLANREVLANRAAGGSLDLPDPDPELPNIAASVLYALANREPGRDYSARMFSVQCHHPLLNRAAGHERIYSNKSFHKLLALTERDRQMVESGARDLREHFRKQDIANAAVNTDLPLYRTPSQLHAYAHRLMNGLRQREGLTREQAFERLEELHPLLWVNLCLNPLDSKVLTRLEPSY